MTQDSRGATGMTASSSCVYSKFQIQTLHGWPFFFCMAGLLHCDNIVPSFAFSQHVQRCATPYILAWLEEVILLIIARSHSVNTFAVMRNAISLVGTKFLPLAHRGRLECQAVSRRVSLTICNLTEIHLNVSSPPAQSCATSSTMVATM